MNTLQRHLRHSPSCFVWQARCRKDPETASQQHRKKRKENTTPFSVILMRSQVSYRATQVVNSIREQVTYVYDWI